MRLFVDTEELRGRVDFLLKELRNDSFREEEEDDDGMEVGVDVTVVVETRGLEVNLSFKLEYILEDLNIYDDFLYVITNEGKTVGYLYTILLYF